MEYPSVLPLAINTFWEHRMTPETMPVILLRPTGIFRASAGWFSSGLLCGGHVPRTGRPSRLSRHSPCRRREAITNCLLCHSALSRTRLRDLFFCVYCSVKQNAWASRDQCQRGWQETAIPGKALAVPRRLGVVRLLVVYSNLPFALIQLTRRIPRFRPASSCHVLCWLHNPDASTALDPASGRSASLTRS